MALFPGKTFRTVYHAFYDTAAFLRLSPHYQIGTRCGTGCKYCLFLACYGRRDRVLSIDKRENMKEK